MLIAFRPLGDIILKWPTEEFRACREILQTDFSYADRRHAPHIFTIGYKDSRKLRQVSCNLLLVVETSFAPNRKLLLADTLRGMNLLLGGL